MNNPSMLKVLAIDPSVNDVGWGYMERSPTLYETETSGLIEYEWSWNWGVFHLEGWNLLQRCKDLVHRVHETGLTEFTHLIIEWPTFYESTKGQIAAASGYTIDLAAIGMYFAGWFHLETENIELVTAPEWKGNASKEVTQHRFFKQFGIDPRKEDHNAIDAVMMLLARARKKGWLNNG